MEMDKDRISKLNNLLNGLNKKSLDIRDSSDLEKRLSTMQLTDLERTQLCKKLSKLTEEAMKEENKRLTRDDFEPLIVLGKGAFGEVRLVRMKNTKSSANRRVFGKNIPTPPLRINLLLIYFVYCFIFLAMKSMLKTNMIQKNQVKHIQAERDILIKAENPWIVTLYYSFQVSIF